MANISDPAKKSKRTAAHSNGWSVRVAGGVLCPFCGRELKAPDVFVDGDGMTLICHGNDCHQDIIEIERH